MATEALISWRAPAHFHGQKNSDWYWAVGIITLALAAVSIMFGKIITGIFIIVAAAALVIHVSRPAPTVYYEINDRGMVIDDTLYSFLSLESFWVPHDHFPPKLLIKSRKLFLPLISIYITDIDPEDVREILLRYIAETEHHEPFLKYILERFGF